MLESIGIKWGIGFIKCDRLLWINTVAVLGLGNEWLVSVPQKTQSISCNFSLALKSMPYLLSIFTLND